MRLAHELVGRSHHPSLVLIHGITESHHTWHPLVHRLAEDHLVLAVDLRGHGDSDRSDPYDPLTYAGDVVETASALGIEAPLVVGHSLGGVVATAFAAIAPCVGVVNVDQPLRLAAFKEGLMQLEPLLTGSREQFATAIDMVFASMVGPLPADEAARVQALRHADQSVVLGTWDSVLHSSAEELDATVAALAGAVTVPYLSLHGIDPGPEYAAWLTGLVPSATVEVWADHGHYPHLVDQARFLQRVQQFEAMVRG
jgi:pimeloyl-ACP methyl ester carboxylesterase